MRLKENEVKETILELAKSMASHKWGAWECALGGLVGLMHLANKLELGDGFWSELYDIKETFAREVKQVACSGDPKDFFNR